MQVLRGFAGCSTSTLPRDISSGLVVAALTIPISMGYAQVAGLPPAYGLFASIVAPVLYALLTHSHHIVFGMDSATSAALGGVLVSAGVVYSTSDAVSYAAVVGLSTAIFLVLFSLLHLGRLAQRVPTPVVHGFVAGISVSVIVGQIPLLLGAEDVSGGNLVSQLVSCAQLLPGTRVLPVVLSACSLAVLFFCRRRFPRLPAALLVLVIAIVCSALFDWSVHGVVMLGALPSTSLLPHLPSFSGVDMVRAVFGGFAVAVVSAIESLLTVSLFALRHGWSGDEDHELLSFGVSNALAAFFGCPPCSASLSRSVAGEAAGSQTQLSSLVSAATIALAVLLASSVFSYLPQCVLAAIVVEALVNVIDVHKIRRYATKMRSEFLVFLITALFVAFFGAIPGVAFGIAVSFLLHLYRTRSTRHEKLMGIISTHAVPDGVEIPHDTMVFSFKGSLSFLNVAPLVETLISELRDDLRVVILDLTGVTELDTTATDRIVSVIDAVKSRGTWVRIVRSVAPSKDHYTRFELEHIFHQARIYPTVASAVAGLPRNSSEVVQLDEDASRSSRQ
jgi:SulP family sulfate permease